MIFPSILIKIHKINSLFSIIVIKSNKCKKFVFKKIYVRMYSLFKYKNQKIPLFMHKYNIF